MLDIQQRDFSPQCISYLYSTPTLPCLVEAGEQIGTLQNSAPQQCSAYLLAYR